MRQLRAPQTCSRLLLASRRAAAAPFLRRTTAAAAAGAMSDEQQQQRRGGEGRQQQGPQEQPQEPHHKLPKAYVRAFAGQDKLSISLVIAGRMCNLDRPTDEPLEKTLFRMRANAAPKQKKGKKDKGLGFGGSAGGAPPPTADPPAPVVALFADDRPLDPSTRNLDAWAAASLLVVGGERFAVRVNPPSVAGLAAAGGVGGIGGGNGGNNGGGGNGTAAATALSNCRPMVGYPLLPVHDLHFADAECCGWRWLRRRVAGNGGGSGGKEGETPPEGAAAAAAAAVVAAADGWEAIAGATDVCYTPAEADLGCLLRVECVPARRHAGAGARAARAAAAGKPLERGGEEQQEGGKAGAPAVAAAATSAASAAAAASSAAVEHGEPGHAETTAPVVAGPLQPAHVLRAPLPPPSQTSASIRVLSYNLLANQYAANAYARDVLFGYCPPRFLAAEYRRQLVLAELKTHSPDVCCLQEVDQSAFRDYYSPHLARLGYEGRYTNKLGRVREGSATFWRAGRFRLGAARDVDLRSAFGGGGGGGSSSGDGEQGEGEAAVGAAAAAARQGRANSALAQFAPLIGASPALAEALQKVMTIAQVTLLLPVGGGGGGVEASGGGGVGGGDSNDSARPTPSQGPLLVANTHLFFHPYAPHIRTMHTAAILGEAAAALGDWQDGVAGCGQAGGGGDGGGEKGEAAAAAAAADADAARSLSQDLAGMRPAACLFVGDLNSDLNDGVPGVVELLQKGSLPRDHWDWACGAAFRWGKGEDEYGDGGGGAAAAAGDAAGDATAANTPAAEPQAAPAAATPAAPAPAAGEAAAPSADGAAAAAPGGGAFLPSVIGVDVSVPFAPLVSADRLQTPYTNYTSGYKALLDYVWHDPAALTVRRALPAPPEATLASFIPSESFPSDHLAICFDFDWA